MKADRLISIILLLQKRKKITAADLADQLGVSIRTIYRDLLALSSNGYPIYCEHGPGGGVCILDDYRGGVKTLTLDEIDSLQLMKIPEPLVSLTTGKTLQRALLKILTALPERGEQSSTLFIDWNWWRHSGKVPEGRLEQMFEAVNRQLVIQVTFPLWNRMAFSQAIKPYGIVAKAGEWYLVYGVSGRYRMRRISEIKLDYITDLNFEKPSDFDLEATWKELCKEEETEYFSYQVKLRITTEIARVLHEPYWGIPFEVISLDENPDLDGLMNCSLGFANLIAARTHLLGWGNSVKVISPEPLRLSILDFAEQILHVYDDKKTGHQK